MGVCQFDLLRFCSESGLSCAGPLFRSSGSLWIVRLVGRSRSSCSDLGVVGGRNCCFWIWASPLLNGKQVIAEHIENKKRCAFEGPTHGPRIFTASHCIRGSSLWNQFIFSVELLCLLYACLWWFWGTHNSLQQLTIMRDLCACEGESEQNTGNIRCVGHV